VVIRVRSAFGLLVNQSVGIYWLCGEQGEVRLWLAGESVWAFIGLVVIRVRSAFGLLVNQRVGIYWLCGDQGEVRLWLADESECGHLLALW
jgi:hypothetical protein